MARLNDTRTPLVFGSISMGVGLVILGFGIVEFVEAIRSSSWPGIPGVVTTSEIVRSAGQNGRSASYRARVGYRYEVGGQIYNTERVQVAELNSSSPDRARRIVDRYLVGAQVEVRYKPGNPAVAVLQPGVALANAFLPGIGGGFFAIGGIILAGVLASIREKRAADRELEVRSDGARRIELDVIPDPIPGLGLRLRRRADSVTVTGQTTPKSSEKAVRSRPVAAGLMTQGFASFWTLAVGVLITLGLIFSGTMFVSVVFYDTPFKFNDEPVSKPVAAAFAVGFGAACAIIGMFMLRGAGALRTFSRFAAGKPVSVPWTLCLDRHRLTGRIELIGNSIEQRVDLIDLRALAWDDEGMLLARRIGQHDEVALIGPIAPASARWLADAMSRAIGLSASC